MRGCKGKEKYTEWDILCICQKDTFGNSVTAGPGVAATPVIYPRRAFRLRTQMESLDTEIKVYYN